MQTSARTIPKAKIAAWLGQLISQAEVLAPVSGEGGDVCFAPVTSPDQVLWRFENPLAPPKQFVLPQTDPLLAIRPEGRSFALQPIEDARKRILFNIRSCDVRGFEFLEKMQAMDLPDGAYLRRAQNVTLISLACNAACPEGFCVCTDSGPFLQKGHDLQLADLGNRLLAEPGSDKGLAVLNESAAFFSPAGADDVAERHRLEEKARGSFGEETCHFGSAMRRISTRRVDEALWARMSDWCTECGSCNFLCPTCYCFSVKDRPEPQGWTRCRIWDSCQYTAFTAEAAGHNPREEHKERVKRRFFHKVSAQYYSRDGMVGCVGCGRCVKACMGTTDMPAIVAGIRKGEWHG